MKNIIISKKAQKKKRRLVMGNTDKITLTKITKTLSLIDFDSKYIWIISNVDNDVARDLKLTDIKKY